MSDVKSYTEDELERACLPHAWARAHEYTHTEWADHGKRLLATLDAERAARVRAEAERDNMRLTLGIQLGGLDGLDVPTRLHVVLSGHATQHCNDHDRIAALTSDLDAARGLLRECRPHVERSPFRGTRDVILARIDAIAPAAEGHKTSESGNDSATPAPGQGTAPSRPADAPLEPGTTTATAPADGERWGVFIGDHRCQFGTGTEVDMRAHAAGFNAGRKPSQEQYEARPLSPIPRTGGDGGK